MFCEIQLQRLETEILKCRKGYSSNRLGSVDSPFHERRSEVTSICGIVMSMGNHHDPGFCDMETLAVEFVIKPNAIP